MRSGRIEQRLEKLEERRNIRGRAFPRVFQCIVRKGREDEDKAEALQALGVFPVANDLVLTMVAVSPTPGNPMNGFKPSASVTYP